MNPSHINPIPQLGHLPFASPEEVLACAERYFEAQTTEEEELALRCYAASAEAETDPRFDELRAVMGLAAAGRRLHGKACSAPVGNVRPAVRFEPPKSRRPRRPAQKFLRTCSAIAACVVVVAGISLMLQPKEPDCVAYIGGHRTTDPQQVTMAMHQSMEQMGNATDMSTLENQLNEMFQQLEPEPQKQ